MITKNKLTQRELEIARLITACLTNKEIGAKLGISEQTVKDHISHIYLKLKGRNDGLTNRVYIAKWYLVHYWPEINAGYGI